MKKLPNIYKNVVEVDNNRNTFYSKTEPMVEILGDGPVLQTSTRDVSNVLSEVFKKKAFGYTKRVMLTVSGNTYETRLVRYENGRILTIDNEIIDIDSIEKVEIVK